MRTPRIAPTLLACAALLGGCGVNANDSGSSSSSSSSSASGSNVQSIQVNLGPTGNYVNGVFTSVTVCTPGSTSACSTVDNVLVDTGSYGLRLLASQVSASLTAQTSGSGSVGECVLFADNTYTWGPVVTADVYLGGEVASSLPINLIGSTGSFTASAPSSCWNGDTAGTPTADDTVATLGANGILGVGPFGPDCGSYCAETANNDYYFSCSGSSCSSVAVADSSQVQNPVTYFSTDNNGVIVELPSIPASGQATADGSLIYGIGTQSNNSLGSALIVYADSEGEFSTSFNGGSYPDSFIDSGSNGLYFADSSLAQCSDDEGFYCPSSTQSFSATMTGANGGVADVSFSVANLDNLDGSYAAFDDIAGTTGSLISTSFDWGLPFFYGKDIYFAIDGKAVGSDSGPFYAF